MHKEHYAEANANKHKIHSASESQKKPTVFESALWLMSLVMQIKVLLTAIMFRLFIFI